MAAIESIESEYSNETTLLGSLLGKKIMVIGHRGVGINTKSLYNLPENTLPAFQMAFIDGADMVELDVTLTWDNEAVIIHDDKLERTTNGLGAIQNHDIDSIRNLDAGVGTVWEGKAIRLLTLREAIYYLLHRSPERSLNIELKSYAGSRGHVGLYRKNLVRVVLSIITEMHVFNQVIISSFDIGILRMIRRVSPRMITAFLAEGKKWNLSDMIAIAVKYGINGLHPHFSLITKKDEVSAAKNEGLFVQPYGLNTRDQYARAVYLGVTGIITDFPEVLRDYLVSIKH